MSEAEQAGWLVQLEKHSRQQGSGISQKDLAGSWRLVDVWDRQARPRGGQARLLQGLQARLEIGPEQPPGVPHPEACALELRNSVRLGALALMFQGPGWLEGRRPLLRFRFELISFSLGRRLLWQQGLPAPAQGGGPFFALIATGNDEQGRWLLARGRGGGLSRWRCP